MYIGIRARRRRAWLAWAAVYAVLLVVSGVLDGQANPNSTATNIGMIALLIAWAGGTGSMDRGFPRLQNRRERLRYVQNVMGCVLWRPLRQLEKGRLALDRNNHQGWYGECFIQVLAAAAGFSVAKPYPDISGIDLQIDGTSGMTNGIPLARAQVKSWSDPRESDHSLSYRGLNEKQFNVLAERRTPVPVYLFLVVVPADVRDYAHADHRRLHLSHAAYWVSLADRQQIPDPDPSRKVTVHVPRRNLLTAESLTALCEGPVALPGQAADSSTLAGTA